MNRIFWPTFGKRADFCQFSVVLNPGGSSEILLVAGHPSDRAWDFCRKKSNPKVKQGFLDRRAIKRRLLSPSQRLGHDRTIHAITVSIFLPVFIFNSPGLLRHANTGFLSPHRACSWSLESPVRLVRLEARVTGNACAQQPAPVPLP